MKKRARASSEEGDWRLSGENWRKRKGNREWSKLMRRKRGARAAHRAIRAQRRRPGAEAWVVHHWYAEMRHGRARWADIPKEVLPHMRKLPEVRAVATEREQEEKRERLGMVRHAASYKRKDLSAVLRELHDLHDPLAEEKRRQEQQRKNPWSIFDSRTWTNLEGI